MPRIGPAELDPPDAFEAKCDEVKLKDWQERNGFQVAIKNSAGLVLAVALVVLAALSTGPYLPEKSEGIALPPIRDVYLPPPALWTWDEEAFIDPPGRVAPWRRLT